MAETTTRPSAAAPLRRDAKRFDIVPPAALRDDDFAFLRALVQSNVGIQIADGKRAFVAARLAHRLRDLGLATYAEYCRHVRSSGEAELTALFDALCTHETRFFREPAHLDLLARTLLPRWRAAAAARRRHRHLRIWCAGCSTGEEPYSLAMTMRRELAGASELTVEILATDLSTRALQTAADGVYPLARASEIPETDLKAFMLRGKGRWEGRMRAGPEIRSLVRFERLNLYRTPYEVTGRFDAIFCRNVLIYFDAPTRARVARALLGHLCRDGVLFVGHAEGLQTAAVRARSIAPAAYAPLEGA